MIYIFMVPNLLSAALTTSVWMYANKLHAQLDSIGLALCRPTPQNKKQQTCIALLQERTAGLSQAGHVSPVHCVPLKTNETGRNGGRKKIGPRLPEEDNHRGASEVKWSQCSQRTHKNGTGGSCLHPFLQFFCHCCVLRLPFAV